MIDKSNEWYLEDLSENIRRTFKTKRENGQFIGSFAPYGYLKDPTNKNHLVIDSVASEIVKEIFEMYSNGIGRLTIARKLNDRKIPCPYEYKKSIGCKWVPGSTLINRRNSKFGGNFWYDTTVGDILKNETYIGNLVQGKTTYVSYKNKTPIKKDRKDWIIVAEAHEPIVSEELFKKCTELRSTRARGQKFGGKIHILSGKIFCAEYGERMNRYTATASAAMANRYEYARCVRVLKFSKTACKNFYSISLKTLESMLIEKINSLLSRHVKGELIDIEKVDDTKKKRKALEIEKKKISVDKAKKESHLTSLYEDKLEGNITIEQFKIFNKKIDGEIQKMNDRIEMIEKEIEMLNAKTEKKNNRDEILKKYVKVENLNRSIIDEFVESIYIGCITENKQREVTVNFKI
ncbi:MAG: recombinase family protein [Oscillospiraceae bacterium]|nr:recombinase family protein [Oscillospiraceae bacterium]